MFTSIFVTSLVMFSPFETNCPSCETGSFVDSCLSISVESTILNCEVITSASGSASGFAAESFIDSSVIGNPCPPFDGPPESFLDSGFTSGPNSSSGVMVGRFLGIGAGAGQPQDNCGASFGFTADLRGTPGNPCRISSSASGSLLNSSAFIFGSDGTTNIGQRSYTETGSAGFMASVEINTSAALQVSTQVSVTATILIEFFDGCTEGLSSSAGSTSVSYSGEQVGLVFENTSTGETTTISGVIGFGDDGSVVMLGDLDDPSVSVVTGSTSTDVSGAFTVPYNFSTGGQYTISQSRMRFPGLLGDLNNDSIVTPGDRALAVSANGSAVGDLSYLAGVDTNLDGVISSSESSEMVAIIDSIIGCRADLFSPFGVLNFFDINAFNVAFTNMDILADWNEDGLINFFDISDYLADFNAGCP